jgi:hypothetical protein
VLVRTVLAATRNDAIYFVGIAQKGVSIDSDLSSLSQSNNIT